MSAETKAALQAAIEAHVADECDGDMTVGWVIVAETTTIEAMGDGHSSHFIDEPDMQSVYLTTGLLHEALFNTGVEVES